MDNPASIFADTINTIGSYANLSANECERFGMTWGCKPYCPVYERGECEIQADNKIFFKNKYDEIISDNTEGE